MIDQLRLISIDKMESNTKILLACGAVGCPLFVIAFFIEGATRSGYDSLRHPVSSLSIGDSGWTQIVNFLVTGLLLLAFAVGLGRRIRKTKAKFQGAWLVGLVATGLIGAGIFSSDPVYGYPKTMPLSMTQVSLHGHLHNLFSLLVFAGLPVACFAFRRRLIEKSETGWATYSIVTGISMPLAFILAGIGFAQCPGLVDMAGAFQRLSIIIGWTWMALFAIHLMRTSD